MKKFAPLVYSLLSVFLTQTALAQEKPVMPRFDSVRQVDAQTNIHYRRGQPVLYRNRQEPSFEFCRLPEGGFLQQADSIWVVYGAAGHLLYGFRPNGWFEERYAPASAVRHVRSFTNGVLQEEGDLLGSQGLDRFGSATGRNKPDTIGIWTRRDAAGEITLVDHNYRIAANGPASSGSRERFLQLGDSVLTALLGKDLVQKHLRFEPASSSLQRGRTYKWRDGFREPVRSATLAYRFSVDDTLRFNPIIILSIDSSGKMNAKWFRISGENMGWPDAPIDAKCASLAYLKQRVGARGMKNERCYWELVMDTAKGEKRLVMEIYTAIKPAAKYVFDTPFRRLRIELSNGAESFDPNYQIPLKETSVKD